MEDINTMENEPKITIFQKFKLPIIVGGICVLVIIIFLGIVLSKKKTALGPGTVSNGTGSQHPSVGNAVLSFVSNDGSMNINLDSGSYAVSGVQLVISYDPAALTNVDIVPATFFSTPIVLLKKIDTEHGIITYVLAANPNQSPYPNNAPVAAITYSFVPGPSVKSTQFSFRNETKITSLGVNDSILQKTSNITIPVPSPSY